jgi:large repetitive protein
VLSLYAADFGVSHINDGRLFEISNPFFWNHPAPVISTTNLTTVQNLDGSMTVLGVQITDSDALASSQTFSLTATTGAAASGTSVAPTTTFGSMTGINSVLATGVTYQPGATPPSTDMVKLTVEDNFGATDTVNFVFAQAGSGPNITLQGTSGKDVILATNSQDLLTGAAAQDQFVFAPTSSGLSVQHTITDFEVGVDKIDVRQFSSISASALPIETQQGSDTLITFDSNDSLLLKNVAATNLHASDFLVHA